MAKNVLISFDDSENAMRAVQFAADHFLRDAKITLFSVVEDSSTLCAMNSPELTPYFKAEQQAFCSLEDKKRELVETAIQAARRCLIEAGFDHERVHTKVNRRSSGVARDIISEAESGYDVVIIGRRGVSSLQDFLFGSVAQKVLQGVKNAAVLAVP
ncbi:MAG: universal stress protein [Desulfosalsimonas sp.]|uniref:universal stress protein n=1 Tax=Desulfosalsimonas sp. TaxID=3073848 RepID=UPI00397053B5